MHGLAWLALHAGIGALATWMALVYSRRRKLFDAPAAYDAVTAADVQTLAKKILRIQNRTTGLLKPVAAAPTADKKEAAR